MICARHLQVSVLAGSLKRKNTVSRDKWLIGELGICGLSNELGERTLRFHLQWTFVRERLFEHEASETLNTKDVSALQFNGIIGCLADFPMIIVVRFLANYARFPVLGYFFDLDIGDRKQEV